MPTRTVGLEVDFFVFDRTPEPLNEHLVAPRALAIHRDVDLSLLQHRREVDGGKLRSRGVRTRLKKQPRWHWHC